MTYHLETVVEDNSEDDPEDDEPRMDLLPEEKLKSYLTRLELQLDRSRPSTLDVHLNIDDIDGYEDVPEEDVDKILILKRAIELVVKHMHRCHRLYLNGKVPASWALTADVPQPTFPYLETFSVGDMWWICDDFFTKTNTPKLRSIQLTGSGLIRMYNINAKKIQKCRFLPAFYALLQSAAHTITTLQLNHISSTIHPHTFSPNLPHEILHLPKLQTAECTSPPSHSCELLFAPVPSKLAASKLRHLVLGSLSHFGPQTMRAFQRFLRTSGSKSMLKTLHVKIKHNDLRELTMMISELEAIITLTVHLRIDEYYVNSADPLLRTLQWSTSSSEPVHDPHILPTASRLCPNLARLKLQGIGVFDPTILEAMVQSSLGSSVDEPRAGAPAILGKVTVLEGVELRGTISGQWLDLTRRGIIVHSMQ